MAERPRRVLIVDDEVAVSDVVRRYLRPSVTRWP
jgi:hypothetical protein